MTCSTRMKTSEDLSISLRSFEFIPFDPNSFEKILEYLN
jgi:hypothetical protein